MKLALFDVDGTLIKGLSSEWRFALYLLMHGLLGPRQIFAWPWFVLRYLPRYGRHVGKKNKAYLLGLKEAKVSAWAQDCVRLYVMPRLRPEVLARLKAHLRAGDRVLLLTGTPDFIAEALAVALEVHGFRAARCASRNGVFRAEPPFEHPYGADKLRIAHELCAEHGCEMADVIAYADSRTDLELLSAVGKPVAVNADRLLKQAALRQGWEMI